MDLILLAEKRKKWKKFMKVHTVHWFLSRVLTLDEIMLWDPTSYQNKFPFKNVICDLSSCILLLAVEIDLD